MKKFMLILTLTIAIGSVITLNSCKKTDTTVADDSISAQDASTMTRADDITTDDAANAAGQVASFSGKTAGWWSSAVLCGVTVIDTGTVVAGTKTITITYDGTSECNGIIRSGTTSITNTSGKTWNTAGSVLNITYSNLKITDEISGYSYTVNGTRTLTKETNGLAWQVIAELVTNTTVTRRNQGSLSITFPNGSERTWTVDRTRSWSSAVSGNTNTITVTVYTEASGNIDVTGTNRYGTDFTDMIITPVAADNNLSCLWKPYQGKTEHLIANRITTVLYGTDPNGNSIGTPTVCGDGYYITYTKGNKTVYRFVGYWH